MGKGRVAITSTKARKEVAVLELRELQRQIEKGKREWALQLLAHVEELLDTLTEACEDPSLREIVAREFPHLEASVAALAVAASVIPPEPEVTLVVTIETAAEVGP